MALGTITSRAEGGLAPSAPTAVDQLDIVGDDDYPTGGTAEFEAAFQTATDRRGSLKAAQGYGINSGSGALTHFARYDAENDTLLVWALSDGAEAANQADLSGVVFSLVCFSE